MDGEGEAQDGVGARLGLRGAPQAVLQFGTSRIAPATPRRPVGEVLSWA